MRFLTIPDLDLVPGTLLVAVGPAASGKSRYAQTAAVDAAVCLDSLRREISGDFSVKFSVLLVLRQGLPDGSVGRSAVTSHDVLRSRTVPSAASWARKWSVSVRRARACVVVSACSIR